MACMFGPRSVSACAVADANIFRIGAGRISGVALRADHVPAGMAQAKKAAKAVSNSEDARAPAFLLDLRAVERCAAHSHRSGQDMHPHV